jgi:hypothetical protein
MQFPPASPQPVFEEAQTIAPPDKPKRKRAPKAAGPKAAAIVEQAAPARKPRARRKTTETSS